MQGAASLMLGVSAFAGHLAWRRARRIDDVGDDPRLAVVALGGLVAAIVGAKLAFLFAEGARFSQDWLALLTGRSITGALLGGYAGVELTKRTLGVRIATGDRFALVTPLSIAIGRIGCSLDGCCPGLPLGPEHADAWWALHDRTGLARWPAAPVELLFNLAFWAFAIVATRRRWLVGNRFHAYLVSYGLFRLVHETARDDARLGLGISGYHLLALALVALGLARGVQRAREGVGSAR